MKWCPCVKDSCQLVSMLMPIANFVKHVQFYEKLEQKLAILFLQQWCLLCSVYSNVGNRAKCL